MANWFTNYCLVLRWQILRIRFELPFFVLVEALMATGIVIGFAFLYPNIDKQTALYLGTAAPTIILITLGIVIAPNTISQAKLAGIVDYMKSWPVPRMIYLAADATMWLMVALPGIALGLLTAVLYFGISLNISWLVIPTFLLVFLTSIGVGYAIAYLLSPMITSLITQIVVFFVLLFSPITFPVSRLPHWLALVHQILPVQYMAEVVRGTLATRDFEARPIAFFILGVWCLIGFITAHAAMTHQN
ncbi:MAG: ABC transporter permease [Nostoc sp. LLA-1]|nr:ABC transporter permease [Cyanocohniella sp. LLY]